MVAEFAYGGYFKGADIRPGVSQIELISQVPLGNVLSFNIWKLMSRRSRGDSPGCSRSLRKFP